MNASGFTLSLNANGTEIVWQIAQASLNVFLLPHGGIHRVIWYLDTKEGVKLAVILLDTAGNNRNYTHYGSMITDLVRGLPNFRADNFELAEQAISNGTAGSFVCWSDR